MKKKLKCIVLLRDSIEYDANFASDGEIIYFDFDENTTVGDLHNFLREKSSFKDSTFFDLADKCKSQYKNVGKKNYLSYSLNFLLRIVKSSLL